jgi:hypothetical protein
MPITNSSYSQQINDAQALLLRQKLRQKLRQRKRRKKLHQRKRRKKPL